MAAVLVGWLVGWLRGLQLVEGAPHRTDLPLKPPPAAPLEPHRQASTERARAPSRPRSPAPHFLLVSL